MSTPPTNPPLWAVLQLHKKGGKTNMKVQKTKSFEK